MVTNKSITIVALILLALSLGGILYFSIASDKTGSDGGAQQYTLDEIAEHSTKESCWIAIEGKVYDVTSFIPTHPGGEAILQGCGKDATAMFNRRPEVNTSHSQNARDILKKYYLGELR